MIEELISRGLILVLAYAYPAFLCFKTLEKNKVGIQELRFWCQYWTIVAVLTNLEIFSDMFMSWMPMYRLMKVVAFVYLWHPSTKGSEHVYDILVRPNMLRYESQIDRCVFEAKERTWNMAIYYFHDCTKAGSKWVLQIFQFLVSQSMDIKVQPNPNPKSVEKQQPNVPLQSVEDQEPNVPLQSVENQDPKTSTKTFNRAVSDRRPNVAVSAKTLSRAVSELRRPPVGPSANTLTKLPKSESVKLRLHGQAKFIREEDVRVSDQNQSSVVEEK